MLQQILLCKVPLTPELFLLSMIPDNIDKAKEHIVIYIVTAARILYAKKLEKSDDTETRRSYREDTGNSGNGHFIRSNEGLSFTKGN